MVFEAVLLDSVVRRIHQIPEAIWSIMFTICKELLCNKKSKEFIVDSFPISACQNNKIFRCKLFTTKSYHGYTASKKSYFFGIKVHMIIDLNGIPVEFHFTPGSVKDFSFDFEQGSKVYADRAYNDYKFEDLLFETSNIQLVPRRKVNSKRKNKGTDEFCLSLYRNRIETVFSSITSLMPRSIKARTSKGFFLKVFFFILGYVVKRLLKKV